MSKSSPDLGHAQVSRTDLACAASGHVMLLRPEGTADVLPRDVKGGVLPALLCCS
jgi:hypothetical protein